MAIFLQIIGAIVVAFVLTLGLTVVYAVLKFKKLKKSLTGMVDRMGVVAPPPNIDLNIVETIPWTDAPTAHKHLADLRELGFIDDGSFVASQLNGAYVYGFYHPTKSCYACVCQFMGHTVLDFFARTDTDLDITASSYVPPGDRKPPPFKVTCKIHGANVHQLWDGFSALSFTGNKLPAEPGTFREKFEEGYKRTTEYEYESGAVNVEGLKQVAGIIGRDIEPETSAFLDSHGFTDNDDLHEALIDKYLEDSGISARDWEKIEDRVFVVTEHLNRSSVLSIFDEALAEEIGDSLEDKLGTELFWAIVSSNGLERDYTLLHEIHEPVAAHIVLGPELE
ncbi:MAG TPA: hypothetical protein VK171_01870 [Fimbriimonas sp.]|nr:hypothetical protein [Fimbriimonas sp.]